MSVVFPDRRSANQLLNDLPELNIQETPPEPTEPQTPLGKFEAQAIVIGKILLDILLNSFLCGFVILTLVFLTISLIRAYSDDWFYANIFTCTVIIYWILHIIALLLGQAYGLFTRHDEFVPVPKLPMPYLVEAPPMPVRTEEEQRSLFCQAQQVTMKNIIANCEELELQTKQEQEIYAKYQIHFPSTGVPPAPEEYEGPGDRINALSSIAPSLPGRVAPCCTGLASPQQEVGERWRRPNDYCEYHRGVNPTRTPIQVSSKTFDPPEVRSTESCEQQHLMSNRLHTWNYRLPPPGPCENLQTYSAYNPSDPLHVEDRVEFLEELRHQAELQDQAQSVPETEPALPDYAKCICGPSVSASKMANPGKSILKKADAATSGEMYSKQAEGYLIQRKKKKRFYTNNPASPAINANVNTDEFLDKRKRRQTIFSPGNPD